MNAPGERKWRERSWFRWGSAFIGSALLVLPIWFFWGRSEEARFSISAGEAAVQAWLLAWTCVVGLGLLQLLLRLPWMPLAVARTVLTEAARMKLGVVVILLLLLILAGLPLALEQTAPLPNRLRTFLAYSLGLSGLLLSLFTIFMACGTLAHEVQDLRTYTVLTKPVRREQYLLGKWLGLALLNGLMLVVTGVGVYACARYLERQPTERERRWQARGDWVDRERQQAGEVLSARVRLEPDLPADLAAEVQKRVRRFQEEAPKDFEALGREAVERQAREHELIAWRSIGPEERATYFFSGLNEAETEHIYLQINLAALGGYPGASFPLELALNQRFDRSKRCQVESRKPLTIQVPRSEVDEQGRLSLSIIRLPGGYPGTAVLEPENGLVALYEAGGFGPNLARGLLLVWLRLVFLAALGLAAATSVGFPVAVLLSLLVFGTAEMSGFLMESFKEAKERTDALGAATAWVRWLAEAFAAPFRRYADFEGTTELTEGRLVPWSRVLWSAVWLGMVWSGAAAAVGAFLFRRREVGRAQA